MDKYIASGSRYNDMVYNHSGESGLKLPAVSLGLWHNFGDTGNYENMCKMIFTAFDNGITHFDLANNYGPEAGSAERNFGKILKEYLGAYRDEMIVSTKAGYTMWDGPYGDFGSRKYLLASLDASLKRLGVDYVDIFYHHRPDPDTPIEETMGALDQIVRSGKALYVGISNYNAEQTRVAVKTLREMGTPMLIHQPKYSMMVRTPEEGLTQVLKEEGVGCIAFSPLNNGILTNKYLAGIPADSRAAHDPRYLKPEAITEEKLRKVRRLNDLAARRGQSMAQLALLWVLRDRVVTSALIGASCPEQVEENVRALSNPPLSPEELAEIETILSEDVQI